VKIKRNFAPINIRSLIPIITQYLEHSQLTFEHISSYERKKDQPNA